MAYCSVAQVEAQFKGLTFSTTTKPTAVMVADFIAEADAEIDGSLGRKYATPITGASALIIVRTISVGLVAGVIKEILKVKSASGDADTNVRDTDPAKIAREKMKAIVKGELLLSDATLASAADGIRSFNVDDGQEHTFQKGADQW